MRLVRQVRCGCLVAIVAAGLLALVVGAGATRAAGPEVVGYDGAFSLPLCTGIGTALTLVPGHTERVRVYGYSAGRMGLNYQGSGCGGPADAWHTPVLDAVTGAYYHDFVVPAGSVVGAIIGDGLVGTKWTGQDLTVPDPTPTPTPEPSATPTPTPEPSYALVGVVGVDTFSGGAADDVHLLAFVGLVVGGLQLFALGVIAMTVWRRG